jgi:hypothetical protein
MWGMEIKTCTLNKKTVGQEAKGKFLQGAVSDLCDAARKHGCFGVA